MFDKLFYQSKKRGINDQVLLLLSFVETSPYDANLYAIIQLFNEYISKHKDYVDVDIDTKTRLEVICNDTTEYTNIVDKYEPHVNNVDYNSYQNIYSYIYQLGGDYMRYTNVKPQIRCVNDRRYMLYLSLGIPISIINKNKFIFDKYHNRYDRYIVETYRYGTYEQYVNSLNKRINNKIYRHVEYTNDMIYSNANIRSKIINLFNILATQLSIYYDRVRPKIAYWLYINHSINI